jgi:hypothetical protein
MKSWKPIARRRSSSEKGRPGTRRLTAGSVTLLVTAAQFRASAGWG